MKKAMISVAFDAEKLSAAKLYMAQKDLSFEDELEKAAEALYGKYVPAGVREFIELNAESKAHICRTAPPPPFPILPPACCPFARDTGAGRWPWPRQG